MSEDIDISFDFETEAEPSDLAGGGDYADFLVSYMSHALPDDGEFVSDALIEMAVVYLQSLTDQVTPPPQELMDHFWDYYNQVARPVDEIEPGLVRDQLTFEIFPRLLPVDFTPLDPDGVEGAIQKLTSSRKPKNVLESLIFLLKGFKKLQDFQPPGNLKKKWRRTGPFELLAMEDWHFTRSVPVSSVFDPSTTPKTLKMLTIAESTLAPVRTDVVTIDLKGFLLMLTSNRVRSTYSGGSLDAPIFKSNSSWQIGPIMCRSEVEYNALKSKTCKLSVETPIYSMPQGDISKLFFTIIATSNVKFYSAIIDLG